MDDETQQLVAAKTKQNQSNNNKFKRKWMKKKSNGNIHDASVKWKNLKSEPIFIASWSKNKRKKRLRK